MGWKTQIIAKNYRFEENKPLTWEDFNEYNSHITLCEYNKSYFLERWIEKILGVYALELDDSGYSFIELSYEDLIKIKSKINDSTFRNDFYDCDGYEFVWERRNTEKIKEFKDAINMAIMLTSDTAIRKVRIFVVAG